MQYPKIKDTIFDNDTIIKQRVKRQGLLKQKFDSKSSSA